ncbi:hypothetical protein COB64_00820 [Candidatus Wolfebacteria bacterium]|nr:MAG: hypothetical protein COB64_00820 [Candidatus Wolfebacteria bacterium]
MTDGIPFWASLMAIIATAVALFRYIHSRYSWRAKVKKLENHLKNEKETAVDSNKGQRTIMHLVRYVGIPEDEILKISSQSKHIQCKIRKNDKGDADILLFEYF